jgi:hypothetical protein
MARRSWVTIAALALDIAVVVASGCSGAIGDSTTGGPNGGSSSGPTNGGPSGNGMMVGNNGGPSGPMDQPAASLHKLTVAEFTNSVHDLLGTDATTPMTLEPDQQIDGFRSLSASVVSISPMGVSQYETVIDAAAAAAFASATQAAKVLSCVPASATDTACSVSQALGAFGRRAFRHPLTTAEVARYVSVATDVAGESGSSILIGLRYAVSAILQSPEFLYRVELGAPSAQDGGRDKYTDFEMASRLASLLWVSVPDDALLDAAAKGTLSTSAGVQAQAKTMLASPKAKQSIENFADDLYGMDASSGMPLSATFKDKAFYPNWTTTLPVAMQKEFFMRIDDVAFSGDYLSLYDSAVVFVNNELAAIYGLPSATPDDFRRVTLPAGSPRVGILGSGAVLASNGLPQRTSPTLRGRFVSQQLLCKVVPDPPPGVNTTVLDTLPPGSSTKMILEQHRQNPACASCHEMMDPIGLGLENFDSVGTYRTTNNNAPVDATGVLDGVAFKDEASLSTALRNHPDAASCLVSKLYEHAQGRAALPVDATALASLTKQFESSGHRADTLLLDIVASDAYRFVEIATK